MPSVRDNGVGPSLKVSLKNLPERPHPAHSGPLERRVPMRSILRHYWISIAMILAVAFLGTMMWLLWFPATWIAGELLLGVIMAVVMVAIERDTAQREDT